MGKVDARPTRATAIEAFGALREACRRVLGREPTPNEALVLWAQSAHETAGWTRMPCWNPAGIKGSYKGAYFEAMTTEGAGAKARRVLQRFRAYPDLPSGMADWLDVLKRGYPLALKGAAEGDIEAFTNGLLEGWGWSADYFTADPRAYLRATEAHARELGSLPVAWADLSPGPTFGETLLARVLASAEGRS